jgi:hypothetical protein
MQCGVKGMGERLHAQDGTLAVRVSECHRHFNASFKHHQ